VIPFEITASRGGTETSTVLEGRGWIDVASLEVNGTPAQVRWVDDESWQVTVPLENGTQILTLTAYDLEGVLVGLDTITVTPSSF